MRTGIALIFFYKVSLMKHPSGREEDYQLLCMFGLCGGGGGGGGGGGLIGMAQKMVGGLLGGGKKAPAANTANTANTAAAPPGLVDFVKVKVKVEAHFKKEVKVKSEKVNVCIGC